MKAMNKPPKVIIWDLDEAVCFGVPFIGMVCGGHIFFGFGAGLLGFFAKRAINTYLGGVSLLQFSYWYTPTSKRRFKIFVPSHNREYIG